MGMSYDTKTFMEKHDPLSASPRSSPHCYATTKRQSLVQGLTLGILITSFLSIWFRPGTYLSGETRQTVDEHYEEVMDLPLCNRLVLHAPRGVNGFGSQIIRYLAGFLAAEGMNAVWYWFPGAPWNYQCQIGMNWDCYFEQPRELCRYRKDGQWKTTKIQDVVEQFLAGGQNCQPLSSNDQYNDELPLLSNITEFMWNGILTNPDIGPIQCRSHTRKEDSSAALTYMESAFNELPKHAALVKHRKDMRLMWRPKRNIVEYLDEQYAKLKLNRVLAPLSDNSNYISLHLRRGDKDNEVAHMPIDYYVEAVKFANEKTGLSQVFVASDDGTAIIELALALKPLAIHVLALNSAVERVGHRQRDFNRAKNTGDLVADLIVELEIMSHGSYFIGTSSSALSRMVHMLRPADEPANTSIFLDRIWSCGLWWVRFPRYCESGLVPEVSGANLEFCGKYSHILSKIEVPMRHYAPLPPLSELEMMTPVSPDTNEGLGYLVGVTRRTFPFVSNVGCEQQPIVLSCSRDANVVGRQIKVVSATFGRSVRGWPKCEGQKERWFGDSECGATGNAERAVRAKCEGESSCSLVIPELEIDLVAGEELCVETRKYLNVSYECV